MSDATLIALLAAIPPTIAALGAFIVAIKTGRKATKVLHRTEHIEQLANSHLTAVTNALAEANEKIVALEKSSGARILALEKTISRWMMDKGSGSVA